MLIVYNSRIVREIVDRLNPVLFIFKRQLCVIHSRIIRRVALVGREVFSEGVPIHFLFDRLKRNARKSEVVIPRKPLCIHIKVSVLTDIVIVCLLPVLADRFTPPVRRRASAHCVPRKLRSACGIRRIFCIFRRPRIIRRTRSHGFRIIRTARSRRSDVGAFLCLCRSAALLLLLHFHSQRIRIIGNFLLPLLNFFIGCRSGKRFQNIALIRNILIKRFRSIVYPIYRPVPARVLYRNRCSIHKQR